MGERDMEGKENFSSFFFVLFQLHDVLLACFPSLTSSSSPIYHAPNNKNSTLSNAMVFQFRFFSLFCFSFLFEEDSLFYVVDDDQLFISVAAKRRWSSTSFRFFLD